MSKNKIIKQKNEKTHIYIMIWANRWISKLYAKYKNHPYRQTSNKSGS
jgi:hypothetical protein